MQLTLDPYPRQRKKQFLHLHLIEAHLLLDTERVFLQVQHLVRYHFGPLDRQDSHLPAIKLEIALEIAESVVYVLRTVQKPVGILADYICDHRRAEIVRSQVSYPRVQIVHVLLKDVGVLRDELAQIIGRYPAVMQEPYVRHHVPFEIEIQDVLHHPLPPLELVQADSELHQLLDRVGLVRILGEAEGWGEGWTDIRQVLGAHVQRMRRLYAAIVKIIVAGKLSVYSTVQI